MDERNAECSMYHQPVNSACEVPDTPVGRHLEPTEGNLTVSRHNHAGNCGGFVSHVQRAVNDRVG
jgi:hypothetical protein